MICAGEKLNFKLQKKVTDNILSSNEPKAYLHILLYFKEYKYRF